MMGRASGRILASSLVRFPARGGRRDKAVAAAEEPMPVECGTGILPVP